MAQQLSVSHTTVSRRIDNLEANLGTKLFDRKVAGFVLTDSGHAMLEYALVAEDALACAERKLHGRDHELSGKVRLTAPDVALRILGYGSEPPEPLIGRNLGEIAACYYARRDYLKEYDLSDEHCGAKWLGWAEDDQSDIWIKNSPFPNIPRQYQLNAAALQLQAAKAGLGMVMLPCFLADHASELVRIT